MYNLPIARGGSSFYYKITTQGNQNSGSPTSTDSVKVNYRGRLINGSVFDQNYLGSLPNSSAKPITFKLSKLIGGWQENLIHMKAGEVRTIILPYELGYGVYGAGSSVPPFSTLIFDIQLITFTSLNN